MPNEKLRNKTTDNLFDAVISLKDREECYCFFEDICTVAEIQAMSQRLEVAKRLNENQNYKDIAAETGASTVTISRVKRALEYGADGYKLILERMKAAKGEK